jgi:hypothetical protein
MSLQKTIEIDGDGYVLVGGKQLFPFPFPFEVAVLIPKSREEGVGLRPETFAEVGR